MKKYNITMDGLGDNYICCTIEAATEYKALQQYKKTRTSSGQWWIEKTPNNNRYQLLSSFGGCYRADETI